MERATTKQTWVERMGENVQKEFTEKKEKEIGEKLELSMNRERAESCELLRGILTDRLGPPPVSVVSSIEVCADPDRLRAATRKACVMASLDDFQL